ncbi:hypothetical protein BC937DRAFT_90191 [Endogone sp. FLAS-F59071]|nr:hypothetical protein BC937DRAFT_90191 [Endogone sp. FLAS-F59071]|eukprot:RUS22150.1 hypothetical protein BC937DRAFT_90191 [Endogone sp. FLAS-F59071]
MQQTSWASSIAIFTPERRRELCSATEQQSSLKAFASSNALSRGASGRLPRSVSQQRIIDFGRA